MQRSPGESAADALDFMQHICPKASDQNFDPKLIMNMGQTPIFVTWNSKKHWNGKEQNQRTLVLQQMMKKRATLAVSVCADSSMLLSMLILRN